MRAVLLVVVLAAGTVGSADGQSLFGIRISELYASAMQTWIYNGFTKTSDGTPVQGSDVSPIRMSFGAGFELRLTDALSFEPEVWILTQEYIALDQYDAVVPTQIETGSQVGDIANTLTLAFSIPAVYTLSPAWAGSWSFDGRAGIALIYRIPVGAVDGSSVGPVSVYWVAGRFIYPTLGLSADYRISERLEAGVGLTWYVPFYNIWSRQEEMPFLHETMLRYGLRVRWIIGGE